MKYVGLFVCAVVAFVVFLSVANQASKPPLPISVGYRKALAGPGLVAQFHNDSNIMLEVRADFRSTDINNARSYDLVLSPGGTQEVGWKQGWQFVPGQRIDLTNNRFKPAEAIVGGGAPNR